MNQSNAQRSDEGEEQQLQTNAQPSNAGEERQPQRSARGPAFSARVGNVEIAGWKNHGTNGDFLRPLRPSSGTRMKSPASGRTATGTARLICFAWRRPHARRV